MWAFVYRLVWVALMAIELSQDFSENNRASARVDYGWQYSASPTCGSRSKIRPCPSFQICCVLGVVRSKMDAYTHQGTTLPAAGAAKIC